MATFNQVFERIQRKQEMKARLEREYELIESAECAKEGIDPLDWIMPVRPDGQRELNIREKPRRIYVPRFLKGK